MSDIICPICKNELIKNGRSLKCGNNHCFDLAKEGYVNLLAGNHKSGDKTGDNKDMAFSRKQFLEKGYFSPLKNEIVSIIKEYTTEAPAVCDICCGEGWYSDEIIKETDCRMYGFDLSKEMVRLAAKRKNDAEYFVANLSSIPLRSSSIDVGFHLFAPFHDKEFSRIIKDNGIIITAVAGENHLYEIKEILYDSPYKNDEEPPATEILRLKEKRKVTEKITLNSKEDIQSLFAMTPYYYRTSDKDKEKLIKYDKLCVTVDFAIFIYQK